MSKITETALAELKAKYKHIKVITVVVEPEKKDKNGKVIDPGESYEFAARRPDRGHVSMLLPLANSGAIDEFADKAIKNLIVGGDIEALDDGIVYMGVVSRLKELMQPAVSFLKTA